MPIQLPPRTQRWAEQGIPGKLRNEINNERDDDGEVYLNKGFDENNNGIYN